MERNFGQLQEELGKELAAALLEPNPITRCLTCIQAAEAAIEQMKAMVAVSGFSSPGAEIHHFKNEAPEVYGQLFYFLILKGIEADRPYADPEAFRALLSRSKEEADTFFHENETFIRYYTLRETHLDNHFFRRRPEGLWPTAIPGLYIPPDFTFGTYLLGWIKAYDRLRRWIKEEMELLDDVKPVCMLRWTGPRIDAIVLFCGLYLLGVFNDGQATIKEIMDWVEGVLGVHIGQFHAALNDKASTKNPVEFLKQLLAVMVKKFDSLL